MFRIDLLTQCALYNPVVDLPTCIGLREDDLDLPLQGGGGLEVAVAVPEYVLPVQDGHQAEHHERRAQLQRVKRRLHSVVFSCLGCTNMPKSVEKSKIQKVARAI